MDLEIFNHRNGLPRVRRSLKNGSVTLGFIGGSITDGISFNRWPEYVVAWFAATFPGVRIYVENAAIGATGSDLAVFRAERDLINRNCDIVFIEFAANDISEPSDKRMRSREGLIRKLLDQDMDLVLTYTFCQDMYKEMMESKVPPSISEFEELADYYGIGSVWMGLHALEEVKKGKMRWEEWLPDGIHPEYRGSLCYAESVIAYLQKELLDFPVLPYAKKSNILLPPLNKNNWEKTELLPFDKLELKGPWTIRRWEKMPWADQVLDTASVGAGFSFEFFGRGLSLAFDFGRTSSEFRYKLDDGDWTEIVRERPWWVGDSGWFRITNIADGLSDKKHEFTLEVTHGNREECKGTNFRLALIGIIKH